MNNYPKVLNLGMMASSVELLKQQNQNIKNRVIIGASKAKIKITYQLNYIKLNQTKQNLKNK